VLSAMIHFTGTVTSLRSFHLTRADSDTLPPTTRGDRAVPLPVPQGGSRALDITPGSHGPLLSKGADHSCLPGFMAVHVHQCVAMYVPLSGPPK
jgi:hypothetical protein